MDPALQQIINQLIQVFGPVLAQLLIQALENAFQNPAHAQQIVAAILVPPKQ